MAARGHLPQHPDPQIDQNILFEHFSHGSSNTLILKSIINGFVRFEGGGNYPLDDDKDGLKAIYSLVAHVPIDNEMFLANRPVSYLYLSQALPYLDIVYKQILQGYR